LGGAPPNKGLRYSADPPTVEEIGLVIPEAGPVSYADLIRVLIAILWRAGLRISKALALTKADLDPETGSLLARAGNAQPQDRRDGRLGMGARPWLDRAPGPAAARSAVLHPRWANSRPRLVGDSCAG
jgi:integrase